MVDQPESERYTQPTTPLLRRKDDGTAELLAASISDSSEYVEVLEWLVNVGDVLRPDTPVAQVLYNSHTLEFTAQLDAVFLERSVEVGEPVRIGGVLCVLRENG